MGTGLLSSIITVRFVDIGLFGASMHVRSAAVFLQAFIWLGMDQMLYRIMHKRSRHLIIGFLFIYYFLISVILALGLSIFPNLYFGKIILTNYDISKTLLFGLVFLSQIQWFISTIAIVYEKAKIISVMNIFLAFLFLASNLFLIEYKKINISLVVLLFGYCVMYIIILFLQRKILVRYIKIFFSQLRNDELKAEAKNDFKKEFQFFKYFSLSTIFSMIVKRISSIYFANTGNTSMLAILSLFNQMADAMQSIAWSINNSWGINRFKKQLILLQNKSERQIAIGLKTYYREAQIVNFLLISLFLLLSPIWLVVLNWLINKWHLSYGLVVGIIALVCIRYVLDFTAAILQHNYLYISEKLGKQVLICTICNVFLAPLNLLLVEHYSIIGALIATILPCIIAFSVGESLMKYLNLFRVKTMIFSLLIFVPIAFAYFPGSSKLTALLSIVLAFILLLIGYKSYTYKFSNEFVQIVSSATVNLKKFVFSVFYKEEINQERPL